ncbi:hypothetical protein EJB05_30376, partial [Eragrostis curvula]
MYPNSSPINGFPVNQDLRGSTTIPNPSSNVTNVHAPLEQYMMPTNIETSPLSNPFLTPSGSVTNVHTPLEYYMMPTNVETPPLSNPFLTPVPQVINMSSTEPVKSLENEHERLQLQRKFLITPVSDYLNCNDKMQILSMEPPSIKSLLDGDPTAILHAHLSVAGLLEPGPIFNEPTSLHIPKEEKMRMSFGSGEPHGKIPSLEPKYFGQTSMYGQKDQYVPISFPGGGSYGVDNST